MTGRPVRDDDGRPSDCSCRPEWVERDALPCFACFRAGFEEPNPNAEADDEPRRSEPADFGGGESTGVQDL